MHIDLSNKNVTELRFAGEGGAPSSVAPTSATEKEAEAAKSVTSLNASHNQISRIVGLGDVFSHLVELVLSHNALGVTTTPTYTTRQHARHFVVMQQYMNKSKGDATTAPTLCSGLPEWISALPPTLEAVDLSYNHLNSLATCTCGQTPSPSFQGGAQSADKDAVDEMTEQSLRVLRHMCPLALSLFFSAPRFPRLRRLDLSHNALEASVQEAEEMEEAWSSFTEERTAACGTPLAVPACCASEVDLSHNPGLTAINGFLLWSAGTGLATEGTAACGLSSLSLVESGVEDLVGLSALSVFTPQLQRLSLHPTPLSHALLHPQPSVLAGFLESLVLPLLTGRDGCAATTPSPGSCEQAAMTRAFQDVTAHHLQDCEQELRKRMGSGVAAMHTHSVLESGGGALSALSLSVYASLLHEVIPSLVEVDGCVGVQWCEEATVATVQTALVAHCKGQGHDTNHRTSARPRTLATLPPTAPPLARRPSLSSLAAAVTTQLRPKVVVQTDPETAAPAAVTAEVSEGARPSAHAPEPDEGCSSEGMNQRPPVNRFQAAVDALRPLVHDSRAPSPSEESTTSAAASQEDPGDAAHALRDTELTAKSWFTPASLSRMPDTQNKYEALCNEAERLEEELLRVSERREGLTVAVAELKGQLSDDRRLIADQRKEVVRLRERRDVLKERVQTQRARLKKRQKEVTYGRDAMRLQVVTAREQERARQLEERERAIERKEKEWQRRLAKMGPLSVNYQHHGTDTVEDGRRGVTGREAPPARPIRSVVLREEATRKKMEALESRDPLSYSPTRFHDPVPETTTAAASSIGHRSHATRRQRNGSTNRQRTARAAASNPSEPRESSHKRRTSPSPHRAMLVEDEDAYFQSYNETADTGVAATPKGDGDLQSVAQEYCRSLSPEQRRQLQEAILSSSSGTNSPFGEASSLAGSRHISPEASRSVNALRPPPPFPTAHPPFEEETSAARARAVKGAGLLRPRTEGASGAASPVRDLSTLSLPELFEAAAAIRQRQLALQQLQDQWQAQKRTASSPKARGAESSPLPSVSPTTPQSCLPAASAHPLHEKGFEYRGATELPPPPPPEPFGDSGPPSTVPEVEDEEGKDHEAATHFRLVTSDVADTTHLTVANASRVDEAEATSREGVGTPSLSRALFS